MPILTVLLLLGTGVAVALLPPKADETVKMDCGAPALAIFTGRSVPDEVAEECEGKADRATGLAATSVGLAVVAGVASVVLLRGHDAEPEPETTPAAG
ncbi:MAG: hypothetical protein M3Z83_01420 [Actinomycetota bacterium]|nr:hypothetical protein [Actinomycetota bacterium]